jgi:2-C-methyl-D-erythritol 4-phosphate cytidylyltransferase
VYLLIPSAGTGRRMGADRNKLLLNVRSHPIIAWTLLAAEAATSIKWIGIIARSDDENDLKAIIADLNLSKPVEIILGGSTRQESVFNGINALPAEAKFVLIHDGARCLVTPSLFNACAKAIQNCLGLIAAIPVKDTIKVVDQNGIIQSTPDRKQLWAAQTPQGFDVKLLRECHELGISQGWEVTDDAALLERCGVEVIIVPGEETNLKVTTPQDLAIAEFILSQRNSK